MKKAFLFGAVALASTVFGAPRAQAQSLRFGIKGGASLSNLAGNLANQDRYKNRFGFHGGALLNIGLMDDDFLAIQPEVLYSQKGFNYQGGSLTLGNTTFATTGGVRYDYIDVPVLLRLKTNGVFFELGPQYSYLLQVSSDRAFTQNGQVVTGSQAQVTNLDNVRRNELGYAAGLGYQSSAGPMLGLRYNGAFTDFARDGYSDNEFRNARNSVFQLYVGYVLGGSK